MKKVTIFRYLSEKQHQGLVKEFVELPALKPEEYVFKQGDRGDKFYIIEEGTVTIEAKGKLVNRLYDGDCFGEAALIDRKPRNASVRCESAACRLLSLDTSHFSTLLKRSSALQQELGNLGAQRRKSTEEASAATACGAALRCPWQRQKRGP